MTDNKTKMLCKCNMDGEEYEAKLLAIVAFLCHNFNKFQYKWQKRAPS